MAAANPILYLCVTAIVFGIVQSLTGQHANVFIQHGVQVEEYDDRFVLLSNGVPSHEYGPFPNEHNPNNLTEQEHNYTVPKNPKKIDPPGCLPMGTIGLAINGVVLFNPYTAGLQNAVEGEHREIFDDCDGHPQQHGVYHYHKIPSCLFNGTRDQLLGLALDGYPIFGPIDESGRNLTTADLYFCHGRTSASGEYRYHMTYDFPYILGCFSGEVDYDQLRPPGPPPGQSPRDGQPPRSGQPPRDGQSPRSGQPPRDSQPSRSGQPPRDDQPPRNGQSPRNDQPPGGNMPPGGGMEPLNNCRYANETNPGFHGPNENNVGNGDDKTNGATRQKSTVQAVTLLVSVLLL